MDPCFGFVLQSYVFLRRNNLTLQKKELTSKKIKQPLSIR